MSTKAKWLLEQVARAKEMIRPCVNNWDDGCSLCRMNHARARAAFRVLDEAITAAGPPALDAAALAKHTEGMDALLAENEAAERLTAEDLSVRINARDAGAGPPAPSPAKPSKGLQP